MDPILMLLPVPRSIQMTGGIYPLPKIAVMSSQESEILYRTAAKELGAKIIKSNNHAHICLLSSLDAPTDLALWTEHPEGYAMVIDEHGVSIWASHPSGHFYGAMTLQQICRQCDHNLPFLRIGDAPALKHRGAMLAFPQGHTGYRASYMKDLIPWLANWKINALYLYLETYFELPSLPHMAGPDAMTLADAKELEKLCAAYNINLIPAINLLGHCGELLATQKYQHLQTCRKDTDPRVMTGCELSVNSPETHLLADIILHDILNCFQSDIIHVGGDEVSGLADMKQYLKHFERIKDALKSRGRRMGIWGDMLLHTYKDADLREVRDTLKIFAEDTLIYDWHYDGGSSDSLKFFAEVGLQTVACSSTALTFSSNLWPAQKVNQRMLFSDGIAAGIYGGMSTAWCNYAGVHEEQYNYMHASGGTLLWSGPEGDNMARGLTNERFDKAYSFLRYGAKTDTITQFLHAVGDVKGPILSQLIPLHGVYLRKCIYHTDNVLTFWKYYYPLLKGDKLGGYRDGIRYARNLWDQFMMEEKQFHDPYVLLQAAPLLMHEHLLKRFDMTERIYSLYDQAAQVQFENMKLFKELLEQAAAEALNILDDFPVIESYLTLAHKKLGLESSSILRVKATKKKIVILADFLKHLSRSNRRLPAFIQLHNVLLEVPRTNWYVDREHEWTVGPAKFQRYSVEEGAWEEQAPNMERE